MWQLVGKCCPFFVWNSKIFIFLQTHFTSPIPIRMKKKIAPPSLVCHRLPENAFQVNQLYNVTWSTLYVYLWPRLKTIMSWICLVWIFKITPRHFQFSSSMITKSHFFKKLCQKWRTGEWVENGFRLYLGHGRWWHVH